MDGSVERLVAPIDVWKRSYSKSEVTGCLAQTALEEKRTHHSDAVGGLVWRSVGDDKARSVMPYGPWSRARCCMSPREVCAVGCEIWLRSRER